MLKGSQIPSTWPDVSNQCVFKVNMKHPRLNFAPVSFVSLFELESDLDMCLDLNLNRATSSNEFEMDFSLPTNRLSDFLAPTNKLNVLPEKMDFSKLLSFRSYTNSNPVEQSVGDYCNPVDAKEKTRSHFMPEMEQVAVKIDEKLPSDDFLEEPKMQISNKIEENLVSDDIIEEPMMQISNKIEVKVVSDDIPEEQMMQISNKIEDNLISVDIPEEPKMQRNLGLLSGFFENSCHWTQTLKDIFIGVKSEKIRFRSQEYTKNRLLMDLIKGIMTESKLELEGSLLKSILCSGYFSHTKIPSVDHKSNELYDEHQSSSESSFILENKSEKITDKVFELTSKSDESLERKRFQDIVDASEILKSGVQTFRKPTKLFVLDNLREWKKIGEGQIEIWRLDKSNTEIYYMLLWDKSTGKLLIHMRLDTKWSIDYLDNRTDICRWSHFNYANCPRGARESLACRFRDSKVAAQFVSIVAKCVANSQ